MELHLKNNIFNDIFSFTNYEIKNNDEKIFTIFSNCTMLKDIGNMKKNSKYKYIRVEGILFASRIGDSLDEEESFYF